MDAATVITTLKAANLPTTDYIVVAGAVMAIHGLKHTNDIDIVVSAKLFEQLKSDGWQIITFPEGTEGLMHGSIEVMMRLGGTFEELRESQEIIQGLPVIRLEKVLEWKVAAARAKDQADIRLLEDYLSHQSL